MEQQLEQKYQKLEHQEHIYKLPDMYIGSIEPQEEEMFVLNTEKTQMSLQKINYIPGFLKIFDEILVNALDHRQRDPNVKNIKVEFEKGTSQISVYNDGSGIDIAIHPETQVYIPEMLFSSLLTSTNYREDEKRTTAGKFGLGAVLTNIFSKSFTVETVDPVRQLKYIQQFSNNNKNKNPAKITKYTSKSHTKITFLPDYERFGLNEGIAPDIYNLLEKRVYDATATTPTDLNVYLNGNRLKIKNMQQYIQTYTPAQKVSYIEHPRWKIGLVLSPNREFRQVSFVNSIYTSKGGKHIDYVLNQIINHLKNILAKNSKTKNKTFRPSHLKDSIWLFVDVVIENPSFTSQTKEELTTKSTQFGSTVQLDESFIEKFFKNNPEFIERMLQYTQTVQEKQLKKTDGNKRSVIRGIPKLEDAIHAGTRYSHKCTLILTEGDSAKSSILSGVSALGKDREYFGIFPLRGKFINVRDTGLDKVNNNEEVKQLKTILGLQHGKTYTPENIKDLRYGSVVLATDSDLDGSHIKGLIMNFFHHFWPSLLEIDGFLKTIHTPVVKATNSRGQQICFYTLNDFQQFISTTSSSGYTFKYYKGLGTSTAKEFKEYFQKLPEITGKYTYTEEQDKEDILLAFSKDKTNQRKDWLKIYNPTDTITSLDIIPVSNFIHKELKHFSNYDNYRSIPNAIDGLKPSQRKVLYGILKKRTRENREIKVAQLASYVSETTHYHHGEVSLEQTIVGMAQQFVGKNNLPLLKPIGQFGTRLLGGKDCAQSRYIFTALQSYTLDLFNSLDEPLLNNLTEETVKVEPEMYYPILPMVLINGSEGIGTGYSSFVPCFNPEEIRDEIISKCKTGKPFKTDWIPFYKGFKGTITPQSLAPLTKFLVSGCWEITPKSVVITELPIGLWTNTFKEHLEHLIENPNSGVSSYLNKSTDDTVYFEIVLNKPLDTESVIKLFKLQTVLSLNNMHLSTIESGCVAIRKFSSVVEILDYFYETRIELYKKRKQHLLSEIREKIGLLSEKIRFIQQVLADSSVVFNKPKRQILEELQQQGYTSGETLIQLPIYSWTIEKIQELQHQLEKLQEDYDELSGKSETDLFVGDLCEVLD